MNTDSSKQNKAEMMDHVSEHYAKELDAQFRTLNHFVIHGGEIGRAHETFLRGILARYLPADLKLGSGFIASPDWTSRQQDILIFKRDYTTLFEVGDCVVIDYESFVGSIEVKTTINSSPKFCAALELISDIKNKVGRFQAIYAWDAISLELAIESIWKFVRKAPTKTVIPSPI